MKVSKNLDKKRNKAIKGGPRRPLTAYNLFFQIGRQRLVNGESVDDISVEDIDKMTIHQQARHKLRTTHQRTHGKIGFQELAKTLGKKWKSLNPVCKRRLDELAMVEKKRYAAEMEIWKKSQDAPLTDKTKPSILVRQSRMNLQTKNTSLPSSKSASASSKKMPFSLQVQHLSDHPAGHLDQRIDVSSKEGFQRCGLPLMETVPPLTLTLHPSNMQNEHFQRYHTHQFANSYQHNLYDGPSGMWEGTMSNMQTTPPFCVESCEPVPMIYPRKISLSSCQPMERSASYDGIECVQIKEWASQPSRNAYEDYHHHHHHRYPVTHPIEQHAYPSCEETNTVHSLTNIDMDFLSVHCDDNDDISVLGM